MSLQMKFIAVSAGSPLVVLAIHMIAARVAGRSSRQKTAIRSIIIGYIPLCLSLWYLSSGAFMNVSEMLRGGTYCLTVYTCLAYTYFHFFNMSETSRRIRILHDIYFNKQLPLKEITVLYKTSDVVHLRFRRLLDIGQLKYSGGFYSLNGRVLYFAAMVVYAWRVILGFPTSPISTKKRA